MDYVQWIAPKSNEEVDRRAVVNPKQAVALLTAVSGKAPKLVAFFACMYYAALRPAEALYLRVDDCELPVSGWGMLRLSGSTQYVGEGWGDNGSAVREDRKLKHRAKTAVRPVPAPPALVRALRWHIAEHGHAADGRLLVAQGVGLSSVSKETYARVWRHTRKVALTPAQQRSPLANVPYQLRHAAVSLWLNAGTVLGLRPATWCEPR
jgi:integrase